MFLQYHWLIIKIRIISVDSNKGIEKNTGKGSHIVLPFRISFVFINDITSLNVANVLEKK